ncbi:hypothetical protein E2C01_088254 [Portunus trituberculatus]|uniref:Uncharacterized protein n=1 Tax=Portunus trituberculatus TaxID=210409 RepID=A0A5B7JA91_PORTR|nr:hypothetical protein [Portunus trituberculatus]
MKEVYKIKLNHKTKFEEYCPRPSLTYKTSRSTGQSTNSEWHRPRVLEPQTVPEPPGCQIYSQAYLSTHRPADTKIHLSSKYQVFIWRKS